MATVFKREGCRSYRIQYLDADGKRKEVRGFKEKKASEELAARLEREAESIRRGRSEGLALDPNKSLETALADYVEELKRLGSSEKHVKDTRESLKRIFASRGWQTLSDLTVPNLSKLLRWSAGEKGHAPRTTNHLRGYVIALTQFAVNQGWLKENLLTRVPVSKVVSGPHPRRAFTIDEIQRLLANTPNEERRLRYQVLALSGLRKIELHRLEWRDVDLENQRWRLRAEITKNRTAENLPMLPGVVDLLTRQKCFAKSSDPHAKIFDKKLWYSDLRADLERAKIPRKDERGRYLDFHAFRYFFCSLLGRSLPIQHVKRLMRHKSISMTADLYMQLEIADLDEALLKLPAIELGVKQ